MRLEKHGENHTTGFIRKSSQLLISIVIAGNRRPLSSVQRAFWARSLMAISL